MSGIQALMRPDAAQLQQALAAVGQPVRVECAAGDFSSVARGKLVSRHDFVGLGGCKLPSVVLGLTLTAGESDAVFGPLLPANYADVHLVPDLATLALRPDRPHEATVICEPSGVLLRADGQPLDVAQLSPRAALRAVLARLAEQGLAATVAPELELFLIERAPGSEADLRAARAHPASPASEQACEAYSLERAGHFEAYFDALYRACEGLGIPVTGHAHESAYSQYEVNFAPGPALAQADAVFRFKRLAREIAARHGFLASFAAKPFLDQPGTGMHWHLSLQHTQAAWPHLFAHADGRTSAALAHFVGGLQAGAAAAMAFFAPHDMSYDRIRLSDAAPSHASWGEESRSLAFRIPASSAAARRVENRLPGGDANPYLTLAATLGLGALGLHHQRTPVDGEPEALRLPTDLAQALDALSAHADLRAVLGDALVDTYVAIKRHETAERNAASDPRQAWDLRHLIELA